MNGKERALIVLLRVTGVVALSAFFAILLPTEWMARMHRWLGLGEFPASPLVEYLSRSISALYCLYGGLVILLSTDVRRFAPVVVYAGAASVAFGALMVPIDLIADMPLYWIVGEGPFVMGLGLVTLWLARGIERNGSTHSGAPEVSGPSGSLRR